MALAHELPRERTPHPGQVLEFPILLGLHPQFDIPEGKTVSFIRFDHIPHYPLPFPLRGFYDLARHKPLENEG